MNVKHELPGAREYAEWSRAAGLGERNEAAAEAALGRSLFAVAVRDDDGRLVASGRIIGDGSFYNRIVDVAALPSERSEEAKTEVLKELLAYLDRTMPPDAEWTVLTDVASIAFYQKHGFKLIYPDGYAMSRRRTGSDENR